MRVGEPHPCEKEGELVYTKARIAEFRDFVKKHRPEIIPSFDAMLSDASMGRKKNWLVSAKLRVLAKHFERGAVPGKRRKRQAYRKRKNKAQKKYCWSHLGEQREWHRNHYHAKKKRSTDARSSLL